MSNPYVNMLNIFPKPPLLVGQVTVLNADGTSTVQLIGGGTLVVRGQSVSVGNNAFVRNGIIEGAAPTLTGIVIYI